VKLVNKTHYSTRDLKKLFTRIAKDELNPDKAKKVVFTIKYWRSNWTGGCAYVGGTHGTLKMPKPHHKLDMPAIAKTIAHEMAHLHGLHHGAKMHCARYSWHHGDYKTYYAWANDYSISHLETASKPAVAPVNAKLDHATKMLAKNEAKLKRTAVLVKKWTAKVKYYQKRAELKTMTAGVDC
jgi:predicted SprT family Zn-dependent metalloprotease